MDPKVFIANNEDGGVSIIRLSEDRNESYSLHKMLFELSRTTDLETHFDPEIHTLEKIASNLIKGHRSVSLLGDCLQSELPDQTFRNAWEWK
jgi:hypothetical protein|tara:strand:- start:288 stop:563 length:276 start_codon:yes stop_codon:yes gene_type:complete